ncbi:MAG: hypothetical protein ACR2ML_10005 [Solirubrobacteraceae bacterium]
MDEDERRQHGQALLEAIDASTRRDQRQLIEHLQGVTESVTPPAPDDAPEADPGPPVIGMTDEQLIRQGAQLRGHGLL